MTGRNIRQMLKSKIYSVKCHCQSLLASIFMALYKHQFLSLPKYLIKFQFNQLVSNSKHLSSFYENTAKQILNKNETNKVKVQIKKNLDYNNVWYNPGYLVKMGLSVKVDQIIRRSARCFLIPKSYSKFQVRFISGNNLYNINIHEKEPSKCLACTQIRTYSKKAPNDDPSKPCQRIDSAKKLKKLCERLSSKSELSREAKTIAFETAEEKHRKKLESGTILLRSDPDYSLVNGIPMEIICWRRARIYQPRKNPMQSGTRNIGHWEVDYDNKERWENPLMGWTSSGDSVSSVKLRFSTKEEAMEYCRNNNLEYYVLDSKTTKKFKPKSYGLNFHHKKRTRLSTK